MSRSQLQADRPSVDDLAAAHDRIRPWAHHTPVMTSSYLDRRCGAKIFFKCENFQRVGAFKFRGACNAVFSLSREQLKRGVVAHSSGNHAQALALAARLRDTRATIVMPENSSAVKIAAVRGYGARVVFCEPGSSAREETTTRVLEETGGVLIHPFNDPRVIAGQGTAARELLAEVPKLDVILAPVGGGGLLSGTVVAVAAATREVAVVGAEPAAADDAARSLELGSLQPAVDPPRTIADGLRTGLGPLSFSIIRAGVREIVTVDEEAIVEAMRAVWTRMKIIIEPSAAVPVAAVLSERMNVANQRVGIILSGGNVDLDALPWSVPQD